MTDIAEAKQEDTIKGIAELTKGLAQLRQNLKQPPTSKTVSAGKKYSYSYTPLDKVIETVDKAAKGTGITYTQQLKVSQGMIAVKTIILHESGQSLDTGAVVLPGGNTAQTVGSALTYARRYSLSLAFGVASESDDDGRTASSDVIDKRQQPAPRQQAPQQPAMNQQFVNKAQLNDLQTIITKLFTVWPAEGRNGKPKPKSVVELADDYVGLANGKFGGQASNLQTLTPDVGAKLYTMLETTLQELGGDSNADQRQTDQPQG